MPNDKHTGKSNQQNLGTIKSSNLCTEIIEYSSPDETAVCNLASLALPSFIRGKEYDFQKLHDVTKVVAFNLNRVIDVNYYPVPEAKRSNMRVATYQNWRETVVQPLMEHERTRISITTTRVIVAPIEFVAFKMIARYG